MSNKNENVTVPKSKIFSELNKALAVTIRRIKYSDAM